MTLVAALRLNGTPFLIGDFLITSGGDSSGLSKKIQRLRPNLAIGWSGNALSARWILSHLDAELPKPLATSESLDVALTDFSGELIGAVQLVGWLFGGEERAFKWRSDWPKEVFSDTYFYIGSGASLFERLAGHGNVDSNGSIGRAVAQAVWLTGMLLVDEIGPQRNQADRFGFAYEIIYWHEESLKYVTDVTYGFAQFQFTALGQIMAKQIDPVVYQYQARGDCAVLDRLEHPQTIAGVIRKTSRHLITPIVGDCGDEDSRLRGSAASPQPLFDIAKITCFVLALVHAANTESPILLPTLICVGTEKGQHPKISVIHGPPPAIEFRLPPDEDVKRVYDYVIRDLKGAH